MTRTQLEHIIRAASAITGEADLVIVGSQAILASFPDAPASLLVSREADIYPLHNPEAADLIDGSIGELSPFDETFGYYAHGVGPNTAILPQGWQQRLVTLQNQNTGQGRGLCLEPHDLAASKLKEGLINSGARHCCPHSVWHGARRKWMNIHNQRATKPRWIRSATQRPFLASPERSDAHCNPNPFKVVGGAIDQIFLNCWTTKRSRVRDAATPA